MALVIRDRHRYPHNSYLRYTRLPVIMVFSKTIADSILLLLEPTALLTMRLRLPSLSREKML